MSWLGNTPEKRKYNKIILLVGACFITMLCGILIRSTFLTIFGFIILFVCSPLLLIAKERYYTYLYKKFRNRLNRIAEKSKETPYEKIHQKIEGKKQSKETPLFPLISGFLITAVFGYLYVVNRNEAMYSLIFLNVAIVGILILVYGVYKLMR